MSAAPPSTQGQEPLSRPTYSPQQLHAVYERLDLPRRFRYEPGDFSREVVRHWDGHGFLTALHRQALANMPFENLELHYSSHHQISLHSNALFDKIVKQGTGRGGFCLENNCFLGTVMRSIGFSVTSVGARVNTDVQPAAAVGERRGRFGGFSHMVNLVTIRGSTYLVDVGFGAGGPTRPLELVADVETTNVAPDQMVRLRHDAIPENDREQNKLWILERRGGDTKESQWLPLYCFSDSHCFLPQDFEVISYFTSTHRQSFFTYRVVCSRALLDENKNEVIGEVVLYHDKIHRRVRGEKELVEELKTEQQRVEALKKYFDIELTEAQAQGVRGMSSELGVLSLTQDDHHGG